MTREEAIERFENVKANALVQKANGASEYWQKEIDGTVEAIDMVIEALSKPNHETDTEVRLAVTNRKKEKVILWDAFGEIEYYPIEALQTAEINCVHCPHYYETEDDTVVHGHCRMDIVTLNSPISIQAEMVAVVRCKDCKHYIVEGITTQYGWCHEYAHSVNEDDYCSYGERKK